MICGALKAVLEAERAEFNQRFAEASYALPSLDGAAFLSFIEGSVDPVVAAVAEDRAESASAVAWAAYQAGLELVGHQLAGPTARHQHIDRGWQELLPVAAHHVAEAPDRVIGAVSNALHHLASAPGGRPGQWVRRFAQLTPMCDDLDTWLRLGQVLAWPCGMAHYRESALQLAGSLPDDVAVRAVGGDPNETKWADLSAKLAADPWLAVHSDADQIAVWQSSDRGGTGLREVGRVGGFRGFGGIFPEPPRAHVEDGQLLVASGDDVWMLFADAFGATFHRAPEAGFADPRTWLMRPSDGISVSRDLVRRGQAKLALTELGEITGVGQTDHTLVVSGSHSHSVVVVALT